jgi:hypothetical protein
VHSLSFYAAEKVFTRDLEAPVGSSVTVPHESIRVAPVAAQAHIEALLGVLALDLNIRPAVSIIVPDLVGPAVARMHPGHAVSEVVVDAITVRLDDVIVSIRGGASAPS